MPRGAWPSSPLSGHLLPLESLDSEADMFAKGNKCLCPFNNFIFLFCKPTCPCPDTYSGPQFPRCGSSFVPSPLSSSQTLLSLSPSPHHLVNRNRMPHQASIQPQSRPDPISAVLILELKGLPFLILSEGSNPPPARTRRRPTPHSPHPETSL